VFGRATIRLGIGPHSNLFYSIIMAAYGMGQAIIFLPTGFCLLLRSSFFPRLMSAVAGWIFTILPHNGVTLRPNSTGTGTSSS